MVTDYNNTVGLAILEFGSGDLLGLVTDIIINPDTGKIEAFWIRPATVPLSHAIIQAQDILKWGKHIYIKNDSVISDPADVIKITDILNKNSLIIGDRVENEEGEYYGHVYNATFNTSTFYLSQLAVRKSFFGLVAWSKRIFSFDRIIEIRPSLIIINDKNTATVQKVRTNFVKNASVDPVG